MQLVSRAAQKNKQTKKTAGGKQASPHTFQILKGVPSWGTVWGGTPTPFLSAEPIFIHTVEKVPTLKRRSAGDLKLTADCLHLEELTAIPSSFQVYAEINVWGGETGLQMVLKEVLTKPQCTFQEEEEENSGSVAVSSCTLGNQEPNVSASPACLQKCWSVLVWKSQCVRTLAHVHHQGQ